MLSVLVLASLALSRQTPAWQIVPASQFPFDRKQAILESGPHEPSGAFLVNDNAVSDKAYEAIMQNPDFIKVVKMIRKEADGKVIAWEPNGKVLPDATEISERYIADFATGEVGIVLQLKSMVGLPNMMNDKPVITCSVTAAKKSSSVGGTDLVRTLQKIGPGPGKFANIRFSIRVNQMVGTVSKEVGPPVATEDVTFQVVGPVAGTTDKLEHLEVIQRGVPNLGSFSLAPGIKWAAYDKDNGSPVRHLLQGLAKVMKSADSTPPQDEFHFDVRSNIPIKYWSGINVYRNSTVQGYFGHIAMEPTG